MRINILQNTVIYLAVKTYEDFYRLEYKFLKKLLKCTGVATSGYSKMELIASRFQLLKWIYKLLYQVQNIKSLRLEITINSFRSAPVTERINNIYDWPQINLGLFLSRLKSKRLLERLYWMLQWWESLFLLWYWIY